MHVPRTRISISLVISILVFLLPVFAFSSCSKQAPESGDGQSPGVISLLDSLGVGDVPVFPKAELDVDLYRGIDHVLQKIPALPEAFSGSIFFPYITRSSPQDVFAHYLEMMDGLEWEFVRTEEYAAQGSFMVWQKMANTGQWITYGMFCGPYEKDQKTVTLILTGFIIPDDKEKTDDFEQAKEEDIREPEGTVQFENRMPPSGQGLLPAISVPDGTGQWDLWLQSGSPEEGINTVETIDDAQFLRTVRFQRSSMLQDGGAAGLILRKELDVRSFESLSVWLVAKIDEESGGNIANTSPQWFPEGAIQVRIWYLDDSGQEKEWYHGFYYSPVQGPDSLHFTQVRQGQYFWYVGPDMMGLEDKPAFLQEVRVYGFGWSFLSSVAELDIIAQ